MVDKQKNYLETINKIISGNFNNYLKFLKFASNGNIYNYDFPDQIRIFQKKPESKLVVPYEIWRSVGRSPKFKTGIHIDLSDDFVGELYKNIDSTFNGCVFAYEDTVGNSFDYKMNDILSSEELDYVTKKISEGMDSYKDFYSSINLLTQTNVRDIILLGTDSEKYKFICEATLYSIYNKFNLQYTFSQESIDMYNSLSVDERRDLLEFSQSNIQKISRKFIKYINYYVNEFRKGGIEYERVNTTSIQNFTDERRSGNEISDARGESNRANDRNGYNTQDGTNGSRSSRLSEGNNSSFIQNMVEYREDVSVRSEKSSGSEGIENDNRESAEPGILQEESRSRMEGTISGKRESQTDSDGNSEIRSSVQTSNDDGQLSFNFGGNEDSLIDEINNELENSFDTNINNNYTYTQPKIEKVPEKYLTDILLRGSGFVGGKQRIFDFYNKKQMSKTERIAAIKKEYGLGGTGIPLDGYGWHGYDSFGNGLTVKWRDSEGEKEGYVSWNIVEDNIRNLIMSGKYHLPFHFEFNANVTSIDNAEANRLLVHAADRISMHMLLLDVLNDDTLLTAEKVNGLLSLDKWLFTDYDKPLIKATVDNEKNLINLSYPAPLATISSYKLSFDDMLSGINNILNSDKYMTIIENTKSNSSKVVSDNSGTLEDSIKILCVDSDVFDGYRTIIKDLLSKYNINDENKINYIKEITSNKIAFGVNKYGLVEFKFLSDSINVNYKDSSYNRLNASLNYDDLIASFPAFFNVDGFLDIDSSVLDQANNISNISSDLDQINEYFNYLKSINYINDEDIIGSIKVGDSLEIENTIFNVTEVTDSDIKMMDISLLYPITRVESKENIKWMLDTGKTSIIVDGNVKNIVDEDSLVTEKPVVEQETVKEKGEAVAFSYGDDWKPNIGSDNERYNKNIEAIKTLKSIESENRYATADEQQILSMYVGWGGLSNCFDMDKNLEKYNELSELLTEEEFKSARASTTDAFYTPKEVIDAVYDSLNRMGFTGGNVLEPSCGIGNFISDMPRNMREKSNIYAVELDSISGRIAKLLHPDANIQVAGFENVSFDDNVFDVVIGNIPFGDYKVSDARYNKNNFLIHDYFIANYNEIAIIKYGTKRMNALEIIENLLNLKQIEVKDRVEEDGKVRYVLNAKETLLAREKGDILKEKFRSWFWNDSQRYEKYIRIYNDKFNNTVLREYDGKYMTFPGMNSMINLMDYQKSAVARVLRNGNTLLAHCVGAGKSFEMSAACMELRRLGLANKPLIVVPNHLTNQMASEFMTLYPNANILLTSKKDFEKSRRRRFISKIATGDYDAVIIGASQFERIPISKERLADKQFTDKEEANNYIKYLVDKLPVGKNFTGEYCGFKYNISKEVKDFTKSEVFVSVKGERAYTRNLGMDNVRIIHNALISMNEYKDHLESIVERDKRNLVVIQEEYNKPFEYADRLEKLTARKRELTEMLYKKDINSEKSDFNEKAEITKENKIR